MAPSDADLEKKINAGLMGTGEDATSVVRAKAAAQYLQARWTRRAVWLTAVSIALLALTLVYSLWEGIHHLNSPAYRFEVGDGASSFWRFDTESGEAVFFAVSDGKYVYMSVNPPREPSLVHGPLPSGQGLPSAPSD